jgi:hypothetical protein
MKKIYEIPTIETVTLLTKGSLLLDGSGSTGQGDPAPKPPVPAKPNKPF